MENIDYEELCEILARINGWIENCDSKVSTILSGMGVFAGILLATDYIAKFQDIFQFMTKIENIWTTIYLIICGVSICLLVFGAILLIEVLFARVDTNEFENRGIKKDSLIFFSDIAKNDTLLKYRGKLKKYNSEQMKDDIISQIYICALICDKKFSLYKKGLVCSLIGFGIFMVMVVIGVFLT